MIALPPTRTWLMLGDVPGPISRKLEMRFLLTATQIITYTSKIRYTSCFVPEGVRYRSRKTNF